MRTNHELLKILLEYSYKVTFHALCTLAFDLAYLDGPVLTMLEFHKIKRYIQNNPPNEVWNKVFHWKPDLIKVRQAYLKKHIIITTPKKRTNESKNIS